jgi:hypothetical protein
MPSVIKSELRFHAESVTDPLVIGDTNKLIFCFWAVDEKTGEECGWAIFRSKLCLLFKYGYPNDEAFVLHPLREYGLTGLGISKVKESDWIKEIEQQNRQKWPKTDYLSCFEHWIFPFKENTLEVIADKLEWELKEGSYQEIQVEMIKWINNEY